VSYPVRWSENIFLYLLTHWNLLTNIQVVAYRGVPMNTWSNAHKIWPLYGFLSHICFIIQCPYLFKEQLSLYVKFNYKVDRKWPFSVRHGPQVVVHNLASVWRTFPVGDAIIQLPSDGFGRSLKGKVGREGTNSTSSHLAHQTVTNQQESGHLPSDGSHGFVQGWWVGPATSDRLFGRILMKFGRERCC
jgi:hypothetical protein